MDTIVEIEVEVDVELLDAARSPGDTDQEVIRKALASFAESRRAAQPERGENA